MNRTCPETDRECRHCAAGCRLQILDDIEREDHEAGVCGGPTYGCPWCDALVPGGTPIEDRPIAELARRWWPELAVMFAAGAVGAFIAISAGVASATREWCQAAGFEDIRLEAWPTRIRGYCVWHKPTGDVLIPAEDVRPQPRSRT